jgi:hypothetical protein
MSAVEQRDVYAPVGDIPALSSGWPGSAIVSTSLKHKQLKRCPTVDLEDLSRIGSRRGTVRRGGVVVDTADDDCWKFLPSKTALRNLLSIHRRKLGRQNSKKSPQNRRTLVMYTCNEGQIQVGVLLNQ